jgi:hypothetical protein
MKLTVITDETGAIVGASQGHAPRTDVKKGEKATTEFRAGLMAGPGQRVHEIEVPDELAKVEDPNEFGERLARLMYGEGVLSS